MAFFQNSLRESLRAAEGSSVDESLNETRFAILRMSKARRRSPDGNDMCRLSTS